MSTIGSREILVGVDGSFAAERAARWAAREAAARGVPLRLMFVSDWAEVAGDPRSAAGYFRDGMVGWERDCLREAHEAAEREARGLPVSSELVAGQPVDVLTERSADAELIVLGPRGVGGLAGLVVGSVAVGVASHARCPVIIARVAEDEVIGQPAWAGGPVVVGVDASSGSEPALAFAFDHAARHRCPLVAVHAWYSAVMDAGLAVELDRDAMSGDARRLLAEQLAGWQEKYPDVEVRRMVQQVRPAVALIEVGRTASLLAVGTRGRGTVAGLLLGSTSHAVMHRAQCPVAVVRSEGRR